MYIEIVDKRATKYNTDSCITVDVCGSITGKFVKFNLKYIKKLSNK